MISRLFVCVMIRTAAWRRQQVGFGLVFCSRPQHPSIIAVNDFGVLEDQTPLLAMELINGETLGERFKRTFWSLLAGVAIASGAAGYAIRKFRTAPNAQKDMVVRAAHDEIAAVSKKQQEEEDKALNDGSPISDEQLQKILKSEANHGGQLSLKAKRLTDKSFELISNAAWIRRLDVVGCIIPNESLSRLAGLNLSILELNSSL